MTDPRGRVDPTLKIDQLRKLGKRLQLPKGWSYGTRTPNHPITMTAQGTAYVIQDDLLNSYQRMRKLTVKVRKRQASCGKDKFKLDAEVGGTPPSPTSRSPNGSWAAASRASSPPASPSATYTPAAAGW